MRKQYIVERLLKRHETGKDPLARQRTIRAYEKEREEAAIEIQRLEGQLGAIHACAADNEYFQWERIRELEEALSDMLRVFGRLRHDGSVDGGATYKGACEAVNRARLALVPPIKPLAKIFCFHWPIHPAAVDQS
jgi:hypothetical protein